MYRVEEGGWSWSGLCSGHHGHGMDGHWNASDLGRVSQNLKSTQPVARIYESKELRANILN